MGHNQNISLDMVMDLDMVCKGSDFTTLGKKKRCIFDKKKGTDTDLTNSHSIGCYLQ